MKRFKRITGLLLLAITLSPINVLARGFKDVENHWARDSINYAIEKGYASGYEDNIYKPKGKVTRAEFVSFLNNFFKT
ncbi:S-layer homology domain-containing protein [Peptoniphilus harei]|uniref:S-layer homology domain-containing protein n=1 Tax=Peptoniphilus harei TaxID=54005 RepID=UPI00254F80F7|nr:S-layer homology domain-containing protein [Peptoniphilus harei]MDK7377317.1 S-layer homology domain-containing protein [Peptoniphilus harei]MDK7679630.1 S-layer homology domain-containing protein [Peptoniphilus harei]